VVRVDARSRPSTSARWPRRRPARHVSRKTGKSIPGVAGGPLARRSPGSPAGLYELHRSSAAPWAKVVEPRRRLPPRASSSTATCTSPGRQGTRKLLGHFPSRPRSGFPADEPLKGGHHPPPPLARRHPGRLRPRGPEAVTTGPSPGRSRPVSRATAAFSTAEDLAAYKPVWRQPLTFEALGWKFASMPLPPRAALSSGRPAGARAPGLGEVAALRGRPRPPPGRDLPRAYATASSWRPVDHPGRRRRPPSPRPGSPSARAIAPARPPLRDVHPLVGPGSGGTPGRQGGDRDHPSLGVDAQGNLVALPTLNELFGCGSTCGAGSSSTTRWTTSPRRREAQRLRVVQGRPNAVERRPSGCSPQCATIALEGQGGGGSGSAGGSRIPTTHRRALKPPGGRRLPGEAVRRPPSPPPVAPRPAEAEPDTLTRRRGRAERRGHKIKVTTVSAKVHAVRLLPTAGWKPSRPAGAGVVGWWRPER